MKAAGAQHVVDDAAHPARRIGARDTAEGGDVVAAFGRLPHQLPTHTTRSTKNEDTHVRGCSSLSPSSHTPAVLLLVVLTATSDYHRAVQLLHTSVGNAVGLVDQRLCVFVRVERLQEGALDVISDVVRRRTPGPFGMLAVVPGSAGLSEKALLEHQRALIGDVLADASVAFALVVLGESVQATLMRSVVRVALLGKRNALLASDVSAGAAFLGPRLGLDAARIAAAVDELHRQLR